MLVKVRLRVHFRLFGKVARLKSALLFFGLLPVALLEKISNVQNFLRDAERHLFAEAEIWKYVDLKEGVSLRWIQKQDGSNRKFWKAPEASLAKKVKGCPFCKRSSDIEKDRCGCGQIPGLGSKLLSDAVNHLACNEPRLNLCLLESDRRWLKVGKVVFDFTVAPVGELVAA